MAKYLSVHTCNVEVSPAPTAPTAFPAAARVHGPLIDAPAGSLDFLNDDDAHDRVEFPFITPVLTLAPFSVLQVTGEEGDTVCDQPISRTSDKVSSKRVRYSLHGP